MSKSGQLVNLTLYLEDSADTDSDALDTVTRQLRDEIRETGVESVSVVTNGSAPVGSKDINEVVLGALITSFAESVLPRVVETLQNWVQREPKRKIIIQTATRRFELGYSGVELDSEQLQHLVAMMLNPSP